MALHIINIYSTRTRMVPDASELYSGSRNHLNVTRYAVTSYKTGAANL